MRLRFIGEGPDDVGREESAGIAQIFVRRLLEGALGEAPDTSSWETGRFIRKHNGAGYPQKAFLAIKEAHREGFDGVIILVDRDGKTVGGDRLAKLREGRQKAAQDVPMRAVVGVAIDTIEAWLLADEAAIRHAVGFPVDRQPDPETLDGAKGTPRHPKVLLESCVAKAKASGLRSAEIKLKIAERASLEVVEKRCPAGFKRFAEEVRRELCA